MQYVLQVKCNFFSFQREEKKAKAEKEKAKRKDDFARGRMLGVSSPLRAFEQSFGNIGT